MLSLTFNRILVGHRDILGQSSARAVWLDAQGQLSSAKDGPTDVSSSTSVAPLPSGYLPTGYSGLPFDDSSGRLMVPTSTSRRPACRERDES